MDESKKCVACEVVKPLTQFYRCAKSADLHGTWCKPCWNNRKEMLAVIAARLHLCSVCNKKKPRSAFRWNSKTGIRLECKECEKTVLRCSVCRQLKRHELFPPSKEMRTGRHSTCNECHVAAQMRRYHTDENVRARRKIASRSERAKAWRRQYALRHDVKSRDRPKHASHTNWLYHNDIFYRLKVKARSAINHALKTGKITKPAACQSGGKYGVACGGRLEAHHHRGYWPRAAWTDVEWLCVSCHKAADMQEDKRFRIVVRDDSNPIYAGIAKRVDKACELLGIDEESLFGATLECAGEDECDTFLKVMRWLDINGYAVSKPVIQEMTRS